MDKAREAYFRARATLEATEGLEGRLGRGMRGGFLVSVVSETLCEICRQLAEPGHVPELLAELGASYERVVTLFNVVLGRIEASEATRVPQAMLKPLEELTREALPGMVGFRIVLWYEWGPTNYSFQVEFAPRLRLAVEEVFDETDVPTLDSIPDCIACLSFPAPQRDDVLLHSALGHELGHAICEQTDAVGKCHELAEIDLNALRKRIRELLNGAAEAKTPDLFGRIVEEEVESRALALRSAWLAELLADIWGVFLLGPASMLALYALSHIHPPSVSVTHPPTELRYGVILRGLERAGFLSEEALRGSCDWLAGSVERVRLLAEQETDRDNWPVEHDVVYGALKNALDDLVDRVYSDDGAEAQGYTLVQWERDHTDRTTNGQQVHRLVNRILNYVPPDRTDDVGDERVEPADIASTLNAGWAVYLSPKAWWDFRLGLCADDQLPDDLKTSYDAKAKLNRLLLKGVELAHFARRWEAASDSDRSSGKG